MTGNRAHDEEGVTGDGSRVLHPTNGRRAIDVESSRVSGR